MEYLKLFAFCLIQVPRASDRAQIQSKEVRLADSTLISLDDFDVQMVSLLWNGCSEKLQIFRYQPTVLIAIFFD